MSRAVLTIQGLAFQICTERSCKRGVTCADVNSYLEVLCQNFHLNKGFAKLILSCLKEIDQLKKKVPTTNKEDQSLADISKQITKQIENVLSRYRSAFKHEMDGTLKILVGIVYHLLGEKKAKEFLDKHLRV